MSKLQPFIEALGARLGLPLETVSPERFMVVLDDRSLLIQELPNREEFLFHMEVGRPTIFRRGEIFEKLLRYNLFLAETNGAALSYNEQTEMVGLNLILPLYQMDAEAFINAVDNIVALGEDWSRRLKELNAVAEERARRDAAAFTPGGAAQTPDALPGMNGMLKV